MAYTLFQASLDLARILMDVWESAATGGTTSTVEDTALQSQAGWFSDPPGGTLWLKLSTVASKRITGHSGSTITFTPVQSGAVAANDRYAAAPAIFPKHQLIQAINAALQEIGRVVYEKQVAAVAGQEEYSSVDNAIFDNEIVSISVANASASPYLWTPHYRWHQAWVDDSGTTYKLIFDENTEPQNTYPMRIHYLTDHPEVKLDADTIHPSIHPDRLKWQAAVHALRWRVQRTQYDDPTSVAMLNESKQNIIDMVKLTLPEATDKANTMAQRYAITRQREPRHSRW